MMIEDVIYAHSRQDHKALAVLLDPEKGLDHWRPCSHLLQLPDYIFVGGSTGNGTDECIRQLRLWTGRPIILFPGSPAQVTPEADALLYLSVMNSRQPEMLVGQHIASAIAVRHTAIETIPMGYILIDGGRATTVARVSASTPLPHDDTQAAVQTAVAAELLGKHLVYLEAGSGAATPIPADTIQAVRRELHIPLIVGGGICSPQQARDAWNAGADIVVIGNHFEHHPEELEQFCPSSSTTSPSDDRRFMGLALAEAQAALQRNEIPVGCVIVSGGTIVGRGHNLTETLHDVTAHAEMQALTAAAQTLGGKYLNDCTLYVTVEPCPMCAGALAWAQISRLVYGCPDEKRGYTRYRAIRAAGPLTAPALLHPRTQVTAGVMEDECRQLMQQFFRNKR